MSNEVSIFENDNAVAAPSNRKSSLAQKLSSQNTIYSRRIKTNARGTFTKLINGKPVGEPIRDEFEAIVINMLPSVSRNYYKEEYDAKKEEEGVPTLPVCWSHAADKPEPDAPEPQNANCVNCPQNQPGSGQGQSKACRFKRSLAIMLAGDKSGDVYQINIPAKSLFGKSAGNKHPFEAYVKYLLSNGEAPDTVVTKIAYDPDAAGMELYFAPVRRVTDEEYGLIEAALDKPETERYVKISVGQNDLGQQKALESKPEEPKIERSEEPEPIEVEVEVVEEPQKRAKKKEEPVVQEESGALADVISAWGSEDQ